MYTLLQWTFISFQFHNFKSRRIKKKLHFTQEPRYKVTHVFICHDGPSLQINSQIFDGQRSLLLYSLFPYITFFTFISDNIFLKQGPNVYPQHHPPLKKKDTCPNPCLFKIGNYNFLYQEAIDVRNFYPT